MSPYNASPPSSANFAESSFVPTSAATPTDAPVRSATVRAVTAARSLMEVRSRAPHCPHAARSLESREKRVKERCRAEAHRIICRQSGLLGHGGDLAARVLVLRDVRG